MACLTKTPVGGLSGGFCRGQWRAPSHCLVAPFLGEPQGGTGSPQIGAGTRQNTLDPGRFRTKRKKIKGRPVGRPLSCSKPR